MEAFVYCWTNHTKDKKYVGYHKGTVDDGYICSSRSDMFWKDWETDKWTRQIIAEGTMKDCVRLEYCILQTLDLKSGEWYNNNSGGGVVFTDEVRKKLSAWQKGKPKWSAADKLKMSMARKGKPSGNKGRKASELSKRKMSISALNRRENPKRGEAISAGYMRSSTPEARSEKARKAAIARWGKK